MKIGHDPLAKRFAVMSRSTAKTMNSYKKTKKFHELYIVL